MNNSRDTGSKRVDLGNVEWRVFGLVCLFGGFGGLLSWVYSLATGETLLITPSWSAAPAAIVLGIGASIIGVYLLANSDIQAVIRCLAFAALCGFAWKPIYDGGAALIQQQFDNASVAEWFNQVQAANDAIAQSPPEEQAKSVEEATRSAVELLRVRPKISDPTLRQKTDQEIKRTLELIEEFGKRQPDKATEAITTLSVAGSFAGSSEIAEVAAGSLENVASEAKQNDAAELDSAIRNNDKDALLRLRTDIENRKARLETAADFHKNFGDGGKPESIKAISADLDRMKARIDRANIQ